MGTDKTQLSLCGKPLIAHVGDIVRPQVSTLWLNAPACYPLADRHILVPDTLPGHQGPLAGVLAGLWHARTASPEAIGLVTVPGDTPFLPRDLVIRLGSASGDGKAIAIAASNGRRHPVAAFWPVALADDLQTWLSIPENRRVNDFIERHAHVIVDFAPHLTCIGEIDPFFNVNTPDDLVRAETFAKALSS